MVRAAKRSQKTINQTFPILRTKTVLTSQGFSFACEDYFKEDIYAKRSIWRMGSKRSSTAKQHPACVAASRRRGPAHSRHPKNNRDAAVRPVRSDIRCSRKIQRVPNSQLAGHASISRMCGVPWVTGFLCQDPPQHLAECRGAVRSNQSHRGWRTSLERPTGSAGS